MVSRTYCSSFVSWSQEVWNHSMYSTAWRYSSFSTSISSMPPMLLTISMFRHPGRTTNTLRSKFAAIRCSRKSARMTLWFANVARKSMIMNAQFTLWTSMITMQPWSAWRLQTMEFSSHQSIKTISRWISPFKIHCPVAFRFAVAWLSLDGNIDAIT